MRWEEIRGKIGRNWVWGVLVLIVILGVILRLWALNGGMWIDESISAVAASEILEKGIPKFDSGLLYDRAIVFHYLMAFFLWIFGGDFGARFVSVLFGISTIVLMFFIGRGFGHRKGEKEGENNSTNKGNIIGLVAALFTAVLALEVVFSRQARFYQMFQFLFFLTTFILYKAHSSKDNKRTKWYMIIATLLLIILVDTHIAGVVMVLFFLYIAYRKKEWKFGIVPLIIGVYYGLSLFNISYGGAIGAQAGDYASSLYGKLRPFLFISILGLPIAWIRNKKLTLWMVLPSLLLIIGLFFIKVFALRYVYFIIPLVIIGIALIFSYIWKWNKTVFAILLLFALIFPSNIVQDVSPLTILKPEKVNIASSSEPIMDYSFNGTTKDKIMNKNIVVLWTAGIAWNYKKPEYFVPFSLNGLETGYAIYNGKDAYTGAESFNLDNPQLKNFVLIEDLFGYAKLAPSVREKWNNLREKCDKIEETNSVKVYEC